MADLQDFIGNWQVDIKQKSAKHSSGLNVMYDSTNPDGTIRLAFSGMSSFMKNTYAETQSVEATNQRLRELQDEFVEIYKNFLI